MNTFVKYVPNVWLAKCTEEHEKGSTIMVANKYGQEKEYIVFNCIGSNDGRPCYSVVRADGFNSQERAKNKANKLSGYAANAEKKSTGYWEASQEGKDFLSLAEPIKIGHHSEKRHRALIDRNWNRMAKCVELSNKAEDYEERAKYWAAQANDINLSMPESVGYYEFELEKAKAKHEGLKNGTIERSHSYSLTYAAKDLKDIAAKLETAKKLWG